MKKVTIHTDGGCVGNPGPGGWAAVLEYDGRTRELSGGDPATTNNRMELTAAVRALAALKTPCEAEIFTDSVYLRDGITKWLPVWKTRGWVTKLKTPHGVQWRWLRGHAGHKLNERCDELAQMEMLKLRERFSPEQLAALLDEFIRARTPRPEATLFD